MLKKIAANPLTKAPGDTALKPQELQPPDTSRVLGDLERAKSSRLNDLLRKYDRGPQVRRTVCAVCMRPDCEYWERVPAPF